MLKGLGWFIGVAVVVSLLVLGGFLGLWWVFSKDTHALSAMPIAAWQGFATLVYGFLGLVFGVWYFLARVVLDRQLREAERRRSKLMPLLEMLTQVQDIVRQILRGAIVNAADLLEARARMHALLDSLVDHLDVNDEYLGLSDRETDAIVKVRSHVVNTRSISDHPVAWIASNAAAAAQDLAQYIELSHEARAICVRTAEEL